MYRHECIFFSLSLMTFHRVILAYECVCLRPFHMKTTVVVVAAKSQTHNDPPARVDPCCIPLELMIVTLVVKREKWTSKVEHSLYELI